MPNKKIAIWGAGSWATALAVSLIRNGWQPHLWARRPQVALEINQEKRNQAYSGGILIPDGITCSTDLEEVTRGAVLVVSAVPSHAFREVLQQARGFLEPGIIVLNTAKGLEENSLKRMSEIFAEEMDADLNPYAMLSGPSHAEEVLQKIPTAVVIASPHIEVAKAARSFLSGEFLRVYTNQDIVGVEIGAALKNVIALGTGIADGLGYGDNTKAALMTRGLAEIVRLGQKMGANPFTFSGLTGVGDLIVTCTSMHSRNRRVGIAIGQGKSLQEALDSIHMVAEGVKTTRAAYKIGRQLQVELPITNQAYQVLFEGLDPKTAVQNLMNRNLRNEIEII